MHQTILIYYYSCIMHTHRFCAYYMLFVLTDNKDILTHVLCIAKDFPSHAVLQSRIIFMILWRTDQNALTMCSLILWNGFIQISPEHLNMAIEIFVHDLFMHVIY